MNLPHCQGGVTPPRRSDCVNVGWAERSETQQLQ